MAQFLSGVILFLLLPLLVSCSSTPSHGERHLKSAEIPDFLHEYLSPQYPRAEFFEKFKGTRHFYEVKYFKNSWEISTSFDLQGRQIEKEEDIELNSLAPAVVEKIKSYLEKEYPKHVVLEVEKRTDEQKREFIDVEIRHHSSPSGYWEVSFIPNGDFSSRELENYDTVETLN